MRDVKALHDTFYSTHNRQKQDALILKFTQVVPIKRHRPKNETHAKKHYHTKYVVTTYAGVMIPICQKAFLNILNIKRHRVQRAIENFMKTGKAPA